MLGTFSVLGDAEPLVSIHNGVAEDAKEFAVLVDTNSLLNSPTIKWALLLS